MGQGKLITAPGTRVVPFKRTRAPSVALTSSRRKDWSAQYSSSGFQF